MKFSTSNPKQIGLFVVRSFVNAQIPFYLAQNLLKTRFPTRSPTCSEQVADMSQTSQRPKKVADLFQTKKVADVYLSEQIIH